MIKRLAITALIFLCSCTVREADNSYQNIRKNENSCYNFPFAFDPIPTKETVKDRLHTLAKKYDCKWFEYEVDGLKVIGFYIKPAGAEEDELPVIIFNRGGNARSKMPLKYMYRKLLPIVKKGYVVVGSLYRGAQVSDTHDGNELNDEFGGSDVNDILALFPIIDSMPFADVNRVGMYGVSRGAMMSYLAAKQTRKIRAIVSVGGPADLFQGIKERPVMEAKVFSKWIPNYWENKEEELQKRSVMYWPGSLAKNANILLLHGSEDKRVNKNQSILLSKKLNQENVSHKLLVVQGAGHGLNRGPYRKQANKEVIDWFNLYVKNADNTK